MRSCTVQTKSDLRAATAIALLVAIGFFPEANAYAQETALPRGGKVSAGTAAIAPSADGSRLTVDQSSRAAILSWQSFSVGGEASAHFHNGTGATLNRVRGNVLSTIDGTLSATGSLFLVNPAGVTVGSSGQVATGGSFVGTTHDVADSDFLDGGTITFEGASKAGVVNAGTIRSAQGDVALIARRVENTGTIEAPGGTAALAAGYKVLMRDKAGAEGKFSVEIGGSDTEVRNTGTIEAATAEMRANGGNVYALAGNTDSVVKATGVKKTGGRIFLTAGGSGTVKTTQRIVARRDIQPLPQTAPLPTPRPESGGDVRIAGGHVEIGGTVDASGAGGAGGTIVATGDAIALTAGARLDASGTRGGTVLVGGDMRGGADAADKLLPEAIATAETLNVAEGAVIAADGTAGDGGDVVLWSDQQTTYAGHISGTGGGTGDGGFAEVSGKKRLAFTGTVDLTAKNGATGDLLLDPYNVTIADAPDGNVSDFTATGDDSVIDVNRLQTQLASANVTVSTGSGGDQAGDITVADPVKWSANKLTLNAAGSIIVDAPMTATGTAGLAFAYNQADAGGGYAINAPVNLDATGSFSTRSGSGGSVVNYTIIDRLGAVGSATGTDLQGIQANLAGKYVLGADIDASATSGWNGGAGFVPIGFNNVFTGVFDGLGHVVSGLVINRPSSNYVGLFSNIGLVGLVRNVGLQGGSISGHDYVGGLAGRNAVTGTVRNAYAMSAVEGRDYVGGLVGQNAGGTINGAYATGAVDGRIFVGGLAGINKDGTISSAYATGRINGSSSVGGLTGSNRSGSIISSYATGQVNGNESVVGGLVGFNSQGTISDAYATGRVKGVHEVGGLVGENRTGTISGAYATGAVSGITSVGGLVGTNWDAIGKAYATGTVSGRDYVGGLVGWNNSGSISSSYATSAVSGSDHVGGLVGNNSGTISGAYATGAVSGSDHVGGLAGSNSGLAVSIQRSYWDTDTTGRSDACGSNSGTCDATGLTTDEALAQTNYSDFDFTNIWFMVDGATRPFLRSEWSTTIRNTHQLQLMTMDLSADYQLAGDIDFGTTFTDDSRADMWATRYDSGIESYVGAGFAPIAESTSFSGVFDGLGHVVSDLVIHRPSSEGIGLFSMVENGIVRNVGLEDGSISGFAAVGGLIGSNKQSTIRNAYATVAIEGINFVGGLVGYNSQSTISDAYATGRVIGDSKVGGLVGVNDDSTIGNAYATGAVDGSNIVGGLVGENFQGTISDAYATGKVSGGTRVGGLVGYSFKVAIKNAYATGAVEGSTTVGGLVGYYVGGTISNAYATGRVIGDSRVGGLVGNNSKGTVSDSFYDENTTSQSSGCGSNSGTCDVTGLSTVEMKNPFTFIDAGWDLKNVWGKSSIGENGGTLMLRRVGPGTLYDDYVRLAGTDHSRTYGDANPALSGIVQDHVGPGMITVAWDRTNITATSDAGNYAYSPSVLDISTTGTGVYTDYGSGSLTIDKAPLTITPEAVSRIYGNANPATGTATGANLVNGDTITSVDLASVANVASDVGAYDLKASNANGTGLSNYTITYATNSGGLTVTPRSLTVTADDKMRVYGETNPPLTWTLGGMGLVNDDMLSGALATAADKTSSVGDYTIAQGSLAASDNYNLSFAPGTLRVTQRVLTITPEVVSRIYGNANPATGMATGDNLVNSDTITSIDLASVADATSDVGAYDLTASNADGTGLSNYAITYATNSGGLTVASRLLMVTADDVSKIFGAPIPPLSVSVTGGSLAPFHSTLADALLGFSLTSGATQTSPIGTYAITVSGTNDNYALTLQDGTLTIGENPARPFGAIERSFWPNFTSDPDKDADAKRDESADAVCMAGVLGPDCARMPHPANHDLGPWLKAAAQ